MGKYDDIIDMPYKKSTRHVHMSTHDRAATDSKIELAEDKIAKINEVLAELKNALDRPLDEDELPEVKLEYFVQDKLKQGGKYISYKGTVDKIDEHEKKLRLSKGTWIRIEDIFDIKLV